MRKLCRSSYTANIFELSPLISPYLLLSFFRGGEGEKWERAVITKLFRDRYIIICEVFVIIINNQDGLAQVAHALVTLD